MAEPFVCAVMDTNVLVSALLKPASVPGKVLSEALVGRLLPIVCCAMVREYREVLARKKFRFSPAKVREVLSGLEQRAIHMEPQDVERLAADVPDPKDAPFYAVTLNARKTRDARLVTGNIRHFPRASFVLTPREMLDVLAACAPGSRR
ncbi:MAG: PIN domain-containing protein [Rhodocyclaceae bacterium]|nr:PIN domain-containing protein [Rhodocyclaceae bacterium]